jgi:hypothetical protein
MDRRACPTFFFRLYNSAYTSQNPEPKLWS